MLSDEIDYKDVLAFMVTSAAGLFREPKVYGPLRLMESVSMFIDYLQYNGISDERLKEIKDKIGECTRLTMTDREKFEVRVNEILNLVIDYI
ncbi:MAG: DUF6092 family protein [Thermoanaerobacteraceae bacterium]|nr:DUF6092 family protein [Thermoanaerobacteraceae bacterium]